eukprot:CAMPEP_0178762716 /NCGR_PEP_ID=MMETSP0744-20121128/16700_1 /TAXON_ID=913974 /ORGANISM="Nitzschia punctata, Strain CCMP561" /LENGTH=398 /DNA_ID=CAMNT_0020417431 /DNA_START=18 /DNA_END=1214 /DNA_ORIENTATION=-
MVDQTPYLPSRRGSLSVDDLPTRNASILKPTSSSSTTSANATFNLQQSSAARAGRNLLLEFLDSNYTLESDKNTRPKLVKTASSSRFDPIPVNTPSIPMRKTPSKAKLSKEAVTEAFDITLSLKSIEAITAQHDHAVMKKSRSCPKISEGGNSRRQPSKSNAAPPSYQIPRRKPSMHASASSSAPRRSMGRKSRSCPRNLTKMALEPLPTISEFKTECFADYHDSKRSRSYNDLLGSSSSHRRARRKQSIRQSSQMSKSGSIGSLDDRGSRNARFDLPSSKKQSIRQSSQMSRSGSTGSLEDRGSRNARFDLSTSNASYSSSSQARHAIKDQPHPFDLLKDCQPKAEGIMRKTNSSPSLPQRLGSPVMMKKTKQPSMSHRSAMALKLANANAPILVLK